MPAQPSRGRQPLPKRNTAARCCAAMLGNAGKLLIRSHLRRQIAGGELSIGAGPRRAGAGFAAPCVRTRAAMADLQQASVMAKARRPSLRDNAGLLASGLAHGTLLLAVLLFGSPRELA